MPVQEHRARRWRAAAVAAVLVAGGAATVATTAPVERCPESASDVTVSAFYGDQEYDQSLMRWADPESGRTEEIAVADVGVRLPSCVASDGATTARVTVDMTYERTGGATAEDAAEAMRITAGDQSSWAPQEVHDHPAQAAHDGVPAQPASLALVFQLPIDIPGPVRLHLGGADDDVLSLDPPLATESSALRADPPLHESSSR
jgi:hypothetical protein